MKTSRARRYPEKSAVMNFRITPETKRLLKKAADGSGRTISAECEHQLQRALVHMGTGRTHALMMTIGETIDRMVRMKDGTAVKPTLRWDEDPYLFEQAAQLVSKALEMFRPRGELSRETEDRLALGNPRQGEVLIKDTLLEIQLVDESLPFGKQSPRQRWLIMLKRELGPLVDIPVIWGLTAEQHKRAHDVLRELVPLSRKASASPEAMTADESQRLAFLQRQIVEIRSERSQQP